MRDLDESWTPVPVLRAFTGWNTKAKREGPTKTGAKKYLPVHPAWRALLASGSRRAGAAAVGRPPLADDYLFPYDRVPLSGSNLNRWFKEDLQRLQLPGCRSLYACRATFVSLAELGGATRDQIRPITHPSPVQAFDYYTQARKHPEFPVTDRTRSDHFLLVETRVSSPARAQEPDDFVVEHESTLLLPDDMSPTGARSPSFSGLGWLVAENSIHARSGRSRVRSCRRSFVSMVESSHFGELDHLAQFWSVDNPRRRGVSLQ